MNGAAQAFISPATANVRDIRVDLGVRWLGKSLQEVHHGHDLSGVAVTALRNTFFDPGALYRMAVVRGKALYGHDLRAIESADRHRARAHGSAVDVHGAGAAPRDTAAEFRADQTDHVPQYPEKRGIGLDVDV